LRGIRELGRIDKAILIKYLSDDVFQNSIFYTCGPPGMIKAIQDMLQDVVRIPKEIIIIIIIMDEPI
jgi:glycine betaine catabolism B